VKFRENDREIQTRSIVAKSRRNDATVRALTKGIWIGRRVGHGHGHRVRGRVRRPRGRPAVCSVGAGYQFDLIDSKFFHYSLQLNFKASVSRQEGFLYAALPQSGNIFDLNAEAGQKILVCRTRCVQINRGGLAWIYFSQPIVFASRNSKFHASVRHANPIDSNDVSDPIGNRRCLGRRLVE